MNRLGKAVHELFNVKGPSCMWQNLCSENKNKNKQTNKQTKQN